MALRLFAPDSLSLCLSLLHFLFSSLFSSPSRPPASRPCIALSLSSGKCLSRGPESACHARGLTLGRHARRLTRARVSRACACSCVARPRPRSLVHADAELAELLCSPSC
eukprot:2628338-Pleurochrysis_carterae.AAC.1